MHAAVVLKSGPVRWCAVLLLGIALAPQVLAQAQLDDSTKNAQNLNDDQKKQVASYVAERIKLLNPNNPAELLGAVQILEGNFRDSGSKAFRTELGKEIGKALPDLFKHKSMAVQLAAVRLVDAMVDPPPTAAMIELGLTNPNAGIRHEMAKLIGIRLEKERTQNQGGRLIADADRNKIQKALVTAAEKEPSHHAFGQMTFALSQLRMLEVFHIITGLIKARMPAYAATPETAPMGLWATMDELVKVYNSIVPKPPQAELDRMQKELLVCSGLLLKVLLEHQARAGEAGTNYFEDPANLVNWYKLLQEMDGIFDESGSKVNPRITGTFARTLQANNFGGLNSALLKWTSAGGELFKMGLNEADLQLQIPGTETNE